MGQSHSHQKSLGYKSPSSSFYRLIPRPADSFLQKNGKRKNSRRHNSNLSLTGYHLVKRLGEGAYGRVIMVCHKQTQNYYALKYADKRHTPKVIRTIINERQILAKLRHPFICNMCCTFQDDKFFFLVLELGEAGDLRLHIKNLIFSEEVVRHWIAELSCAVEYLHTCDIIHRDIKPENILLTLSGHIKLADFNVAKELNSETQTVTGMAGTFNYLAPEVHNQGPYNSLVDWWAVGITFYECLYNCVPFQIKNNKSEMLHIIYNQELVFPEDRELPVSKSCKDAIKQFIKVRPHERISCTKEIFELEYFGIFAGQEHEMIVDAENKTSGILTPVYRPSLNVFKDIDNTNLYLRRKDMEKEYSEFINYKTKHKQEQIKQIKARKFKEIEMQKRNQHLLPPVLRVVNKPVTNTPKLEHTIKALTSTQSIIAPRIPPGTTTDLDEMQHGKNFFYTASRDKFKNRFFKRSCSCVHRLQPLSPQFIEEIANPTTKVPLPKSASGLKSAIIANNWKPRKANIEMLMTLQPRFDLQPRSTLLESTQHCVHQPHRQGCRRRRALVESLTMVEPFFLPVTPFKPKWRQL
jgi:serine/threonine protein kinase